MKKPYNSRFLITAIIFIAAIAYGTPSHAQSVMNIIPDTPADTVAIQKALRQPDSGPFVVKAVLSVYPDVPTGNINIKWENQKLWHITLIKSFDLQKFRKLFQRQATRQ